MRIPEEFEGSVYIYLAIIGAVIVIIKMLIARKKVEDDEEWEQIEQELDELKNKEVQKKDDLHA